MSQEKKAEPGEPGEKGEPGEPGEKIKSASINLFVNPAKQNELIAELTVGNIFSTDTVEIDTVELSTINVEQITCNQGVAESELITVAVIKGTESAELEAYAARAALLRGQCELQPTEVVSILASDKVAARADGKILVCILLTLLTIPNEQGTLA
ncbi:MAG: collagen-like protein, partial [Hydrococcus sp. SU_1_0]|nr:collagen-like protein [Hydrococcus sp. SU_1_0]